MEPLALPILAAALLFFILLGILIGARNPPRFWMDEKRLPDRQVKPGRRERGIRTQARTSGRRRG
jgi:hypothetical protein